MRPLKCFASFLIYALLLAACASPAATLPPTTAAAPTAVPPAVAATAAADAAATVAPIPIPASTAAANAAASAAPSQAVAAPDKGLFFARPEGGAGPLVAYDLSTGAVRFSLPAGRLSADGQHYFTAAADGADTLFGGYDLATGLAHLQARVSGQWELGAVSSDGGWAALARVYPATQKKQWTDNAWVSEIRILDGQTGKTAQAVSLAGNFDVDGLSRAGDALYLIQYLPAGKPDHYVVRVYDRATQTLQDGALVDKRATSEVMAGDRWSAVGSPDGTWLLTLYLRTKEGTAFIHALNLANRFAWCFDLPSKAANLEQLKYYTLALGPDFQTIFAANAALGVVAKVNLNDLSVVQSAKFEPANPTSLFNPLSRSTSAVAPGGRALYFTNGAQAWAYDDQTGAVRSFWAPGPISGLGVSPDAARVYLARPGQRLVILDAESGAALGQQEGSTKET